MESNTKSRPLVSIVMATYNGERFLREQLDSIISQSYSHLEIIIQDDGSSDETCTIVKSYAAKDPRIRFSQNDENLGILQNFCDLISKANGEYIAISDQDDIWKPEKIGLLLKHIGDNSLVYTDSILIDASGCQTGTTLLQTLGQRPRSSKGLLNLFAENTVSGHACMFSKSIAPSILSNRYDKCFEHIMYDQFIAALASLIDGVKYLEAPLTLHRIHDRNSHNRNIDRQNNSKSSDGRSSPAFFKRKKQRALLKIEAAKSKLILMKKISDKYLPSNQNPFVDHDVEKVFHYCFFNRQLYRRLLEVGIDKVDAKAVSKGRLYFLFFKVF